ncbi:MAG: hypothetical protein AB1941_03580 [Gemmatimonadota bacterium]
MPPIRIDGVGLIAANVRGLERAIGFYRDALGLAFLVRILWMAFLRDSEDNPFALMSEVPRA